jgi:UDPglucose--hexose-1-phosphate uridylyltransferase
MIDWTQHPHRRFNPLTGRWVLVSPHRNNRPWQGQVEPASAAKQETYDPACYLCPGNARVGGVTNPNYAATFIFDNDFPALHLDTPAVSIHDGFIRSETERGVCRVVCFSPRHDLTMARMEPVDVAGVVDAWCDQYQELGALPSINHVQIFENRGEMVGASNPHPHCQIWATSTVPDEVAIETTNQAAHQLEHGSCLLCDYVSLEKQSERIVCENDSFAALVPFWAVWPFEVMVIAKRHVTGLDELQGAERVGLADILRQVAIRYDNLFETPFPCSMGLHQRPTDGPADAPPHPSWHFHAHFYPPLLRSATVRKFMVGFELLAIPQRDLTAEQAAARLRAVSAEHYSRRL